MELLYQSDQYLVLHIAMTRDDGSDSRVATSRAGYEIVDKSSRHGIFIEGPLAERFRAGVQALVADESDMEQFDDFIGAFAGVPSQPLRLH